MHTLPDWLAEAPLQQFFAATRDAGGEARVVGGAVRDFLLSEVGGDVDVASTLLPERTMELAAQQGWKAVSTGIDHGTVTLVLPNRVIEVTTLRRDVTTDGRHAVVAYTDNWAEDAARRDFTMNALYMDAQGTLYDEVGGQADAAARRVRFIGDAGQRIAEDSLRMLRYFRFLATHGKPPADADALAAIAGKKDILAHLSGERIANEMRKLLAADAPAYALRLMAEAGLAPLLFGTSITPARMIRLQMLESQARHAASAWARLVVLIALPSPHPEFSQKKIQTSPKGEVEKPVLGFSGEGLAWLITRWKLSRHEAKQLTLLAALPTFAADAPRHFHTRMLRLHGAPVYLDWLLLQAAATPGIDIAPYVALAHEFVPPTFPITAQDLLARGMKQGKALGDRLSLLETQWEESDYTLSKEELLATPP